MTERNITRASFLQIACGVAAFALPVLGGCSGGGSSVAGTYSGQNGGTLVLKSDGTFTYTYGKHTTSGKWYIKAVGDNDYVVCPELNNQFRISGNRLIEVSRDFREINNPSTLVKK